MLNALLFCFLILFMFYLQMIFLLLGAAIAVNSKALLSGKSKSLFPSWFQIQRYLFLFYISFYWILFPVHKLKQAWFEHKVLFFFNLKLVY